MTNDVRIGLALSGGGTRAAVFHLGVLLYLSEISLLEQVARLSTVSGGSLVAALVFSNAGLKWPTSQQYKETVFPELRTLLTSVDLFSLTAVSQYPQLWGSIAFSRSRIVADLLERRWSVRGVLRDLGKKPLWLINTTCIETGRNWRFSQEHMGDWRAGHHYEPNVRIADAAAASAAVPYVIGAIKLKLPDDGWYSIDPATDNPRRRQDRPFESVSLWDGGAYENLGIEPLYKMDRGMIGCDRLIISDASGPLTEGNNRSLFDLLRGNLASPRLFDIASDQIRSLRSRIVVRAFEEQKARGALIRMGNSVRDIDIRAERLRPASEYDAFQADRQASLALKYPTNLSALTPSNFDRVARHGYEVAAATIDAYCPDLAE